MAEDRPGSAFGTGLDPWLTRLGNLRNVVRQELVTRQLSTHLPAPNEHPGPLRVLDVGAGQGTQALRLARAGHAVTAVEPDPRMRAAFEEAAAALGDEERERVTLRSAGLAGLASVTSPAAYDVVLCHGVLMYLPESGAAISLLAGRVAPEGLLSVVVRNAEALAWRPSALHEWTDALAMLDEQERAAGEHRDPWYVNEIGVRARADRLEDLTRALVTQGMEVERWYGIRVASDDAPVDAPAPAPAELALLVAVEERLGRTDPYRRLGTLLHVVARAPEARRTP